MWWVVSAALAQDSILAITVQAPDGTTALQDELVLPADRVVPAPDGKHALGIYAATFDQNRAVIELVAGPMKDNRPKAKVTKSVELDPRVERAETLTYKKSTWSVVAKVGTVWDPPAPVPVEDPNRYVLAWDDAALLLELVEEKKEEPKGQKKKAPKPGDVAPVTKERELPEGRTDPLAQASPMRIVDTPSDTHLKLETVPNPGPAHCQVGGPPLDPAAPATFFVSLKDLVPRVTAKEVAARLPDGTGYKVAAGVPVVAEGEGTWRVKTGGLSFLIQATEDDLAFYYRPSAHFTGTSTPPVQAPPGVLGRTALGEVTWDGPDPIGIVGLRGVAAPIAIVQVPCAEVRYAIDPAMLAK